jgi:hypothetical protein
MRVLFVGINGSRTGKEVASGGAGGGVGRSKLEDGHVMIPHKYLTEGRM